MIRAIIGGFIGGAIGAAIWAGIALAFEVELGILAWAIGGLVGFGVAVGAKDTASMSTGVLAAILAIGSIAFGKFAAVSIVVDRYVQKEFSQEALEQKLAANFDDDSAKMYMADSLLQDAGSKGVVYKWPEGMNRETAEKPEDYPKELWKDVEKRWTGLDAPAREKYKDDAKHAMVDQMMGAMGELKAAAKSEGFKASFSFFDAIWAFLAIGTAYRIGCQDD